MATMESILKTGQQLYASKKDAEGSITLGFSNYLIITMAAMHLTFGTLLTTNQFVGQPLTCVGEGPMKEEYCGSEYHFEPVGTGLIDRTRTYAYFRITHWILLSIGKIIF